MAGSLCRVAVAELELLAASAGTRIIAAALGILGGHPVHHAIRILAASHQPGLTLVHAGR
jgi:hypothetical protein